MSSFTAADVTKQMTAYDTLVRNALDAGTLVSFMEQHLPAIKQFYGTCKKLTGEPAAAYRRDCFLHAFIRAHKTEAGNPTFVDDLKKKRVKFDAATRRPAASTTGAAALSVPATGHRKTFVSVAETVGNGSADVVMGPPPAAVLPPAAVVLPAAAQFPAASRPPVRPVHPISRSTTAPSPGKRAPPPTAKAKRVRQEVSENGAAAGPGPSTKSNMAAANVRFATPPRKTFTALEEEEEEEEEEQEGDEQEQDEDDQLDGEEAIRMMDEEGPRPRTRSKGIGKIVENDGESSDWDAYRRSPVRVRPRASRASRRTAAPRAPRSAPRRTGRELQPPCSTCQLADKICQESVNGGACFSCKQSKRKCEFAEKKTVRKVKSKARIESDDDEEETQVTPPPSSRARGTRQSSRAAGKQRARSPDVTMDRGATMEIEREVQANAEVVYQPTHLRPGVRAAGVAQTPEETFGLIAARLELMTENAQRALAVPRADRLELQMRRCETAVDAIKTLVLELCDYAGIFPVGLERLPLRPRLPDLPDPEEVGVNVYRMMYRERAVGPDIPVGQIFGDRLETPGPPSPPPMPSTPPHRSPEPAAQLSSPAAPPSLPVATPSPPPPPSLPVATPSPPPPPPSPSLPPSPHHSTVGTDVEMAAASPLPAAHASVPPPTPDPQPAPTVSCPLPPLTLDSQVAPPPVPPLHLIGATPDNSQEARAAGILPLPTTPPSDPPAAAGPSLPSKDVLVDAGTQDPAVAEPLGTQGERPARRPRGRTPNPLRLEPPSLLGVQTRSRTRSPSPAMLAGDKRKGDEASDGDVEKKKRKL